MICKHIQNIGLMVANRVIFSQFLTSILYFSEKDNGKKKPDRARDAKKVVADNQNDSSDDEDSNQAGE